MDAFIILAEIHISKFIFTVSWSYRAYCDTCRNKLPINFFFNVLWQCYEEEPSFLGLDELGSDSDFFPTY